ncbi:MAG: carbohydrate ABC transporter permease [Oscillospiraceae bacterium]|jgi:N-acetylglucosamine transport system permease protein|nr:carbohydrate ABC transporter permease [Oscillospiraceae bacterium]MCI8721146.1 carbohydrate ABC transporter permease [Oscillospiraceae bacterium]MCI8941861.1 carbohydrate ABC transporter permease [Oscillospiraceae bacterium]
MRKINWKKEARLLPGYLIVALWVLFTAVMLFWILGASLSTSREIFSGEVLKFASGFHWENYVTAWQVQNVSVFFGNSLLYSVVSCIGVLAIAAPAAYVLSRWQFRGGAALRIGLVVAMSVPVIMIIMPIYALATQWGIKGRLLLVILYILMRVPYTAIYLLDFFSTLSRTYEEAAYLDGCSGPKTFLKIMLPLVQPAVVTVTIFNFMSVWNEFFMALIFTTSESTYPVGVGLLNIINSMKYTGNYGGMFAAVIIVFLPTFLLYIFMSEKIIAGVTGGGVKG